MKEWKIKQLTGWGFKVKITDDNKCTIAKKNLPNDEKPEIELEVTFYGEDEKGQIGIGRYMGWRVEEDYVNANIMLGYELTRLANTGYTEGQPGIIAEQYE